MKKMCKNAGTEKVELWNTGHYFPNFPIIRKITEIKISGKKENNMPENIKKRKNVSWRSFLFLLGARKMHGLCRTPASCWNLL